MKKIKSIFRCRRSLVWFIVSCVVAAVLIAATLVVTQVQLIYGTLNLLLGGVRPVTADGGEATYVTADGVTSKETAYEAAKEFNEKIEEEGAILLKNDGSLPLEKGASISVFGQNSVDLVYSGSGSSASASVGFTDLYDGLSDYNVNSTLKAFYEDIKSSGGGRPENPGMDGTIVTGFATGETPVSSYTNAVKESFSKYNDAALVVISRMGGEGFDLPRTMVAEDGSIGMSYYGDNAVSGANAQDHYLMLDNNEKAMIELACENFDKVIIILNTSSTMELGDLENNDDVNAILWMGLPGQTGAAVIGDILDGTINPSGRTTDTYATDFTSAPSYYNFGDNMTQYGNAYLKDGGDTYSFRFVDYEEGIYVGYRYYETRGYTEIQDNPDSTWYSDNVVYPFGYGLSYTNFEWTVESVSLADGSELSANGEITVKVKVENTGNYAGKDVVEMYYKVPYYDGGIEKAYIELGAFAKTEEIQPGKSDTVTLTMNVEDMKSYDYSGVVVNGGGYVLESGNYSIVISENIHADPVAEYTYKLSENIYYDSETVYNRFDDVSEGITVYLSRSDWEGTWPVAPTAEERTVTAAWMRQANYSVSDTSDDPWYTEEMPATNSADSSVTFKDLVGLDYDDEKWDSFMDRLDLGDMAYFVANGAFGTASATQILADYGVPMVLHEDGPSGFANFMEEMLGMRDDVYDVCNYAAESVLGATWNTELAYEMGKSLGDEALIGNEQLPYSGWYGPAVNIHRSPFGGRNWEYYSEDTYLSGIMAQNVIKGCNEKGLYVFVKHFALNDQETDRSGTGLMVWANEQAIREIYLKPFEIALEGNDKAGVMSAFTRIGFTWTGGSYELLTEVLRGEWGNNCCVVTDYAVSQSYMNVEQMIRAGGDFMLSQGDKTPSTTNVTATQAAAIRRATKNVLYAIANSSAMQVEIVGYKLPVWETVLIAIDCVVFVAIVVWGVFSIRYALKKDKSAEAESSIPQDKQSE